MDLLPYKHAQLPFLQYEPLSYCIMASFFQCLIKKIASQFFFYKHLKPTFILTLASNQYNLKFLKTNHAMRPNAMSFEGGVQIQIMLY